MKFIIGIDISSQNSGIVVIDKETKRLVEIHQIKMKSFKKYNNDLEYYQELKLLFKEKFSYNEAYFNNCIVIMELNLRHSSLVKALGMGLSILSDMFNPIDIIYKDPTKGYNELKLGNGRDTRVTRKQKALAFFLANEDQGTKALKPSAFSEDEVDAYCIAMSGFFGKN